MRIRPAIAGRRPITSRVFRRKNRHTVMAVAILAADRYLAEPAQGNVATPVTGSNRLPAGRMWVTIPDPPNGPDRASRAFRAS